MTVSSSTIGPMHYVGLDVHQKRSSMCILDCNGKCVKRMEVKGPWNKLLEEIDRHVPKPFAVCYEASCGYGVLHDQLARRAARVCVAHPGQLRLIFRSKKKNDRVDAEKVAKLLYLDEVPAVHVPSVDVRAWRGLIEFRRRLMDKRVVTKNQLRALLRGLGIAAPKSLWSKKGIEWLKEQQLAELDLLRRDLLIDELDEFNQKIRRVEKQLAKIAAAHPGVKLLMTIPGVGIRTSEAFVAYVDKIERFSRYNRVGSYFGLVPCQDSSADVNRLGHITKEGPATLRKLLGESAWQCVRRSPSMKRWFERVMRNDKERRKIAVVAVAHRLCRIMAAMLRTGQAWREDEPDEPGNPLPLHPANQEKQNIQEDRCAGGEELRLSHCASSGRQKTTDQNPSNQGSGPTAGSDRPDDPRTIHVGAPVARQQSRILRVDQPNVTQDKSAEHVTKTTGRDNWQ